METNISDTPITDAAWATWIANGCAQRLLEESKKLERQNAQLRSELLACYNRIPGIEQIIQLPEPILSGTVSDTIHAYGMMQENKINRLEDHIEQSWLIISNVSQGNWKKQSDDWVSITMKWIDETRPVLSEVYKKRAKVLL